jgi:hypothetical protein
LDFFGVAFPQFLKLLNGKAPMLFAAGRFREALKSLRELWLANCYFAFAGHATLLHSVLVG